MSLDNRVHWRELAGLAGDGLDLPSSSELGLSGHLGRLHLLVDWLGLHGLGHLSLVGIYSSLVRDGLRGERLSLRQLLGVFRGLDKGILGSLERLTGLRELPRLLGGDEVLLLACLLLRGWVHEGVLP